MNVSRRSVIKSIAATLFAPTVLLRKQIDREALMIPFCGEDFRYSFKEPFQQGSLTYCTDNRKMIRGELACPELAGERRLPDVVRFWGNTWRDGQWIEIEKPSVSQLLLPIGDDKRGYCPECLGRRVSLGESYPEFSDPDVDAHVHALGYDIDDNTVRDESCPLCNGRAYRGGSEIELLGQRYSFHHLSPIFSLPNVKFSPSADEAFPMMFKADGFEGMVMPCVRS